ncbi:hypothetical protein BDZ91DRAFT_725291 [Kalaharituber pfeilii]|nr:hypothetical protein BDZ91DRAFT_725291 [Kalaharituber pfeilii]
MSHLQIPQLCLPPSYSRWEHWHLTQLKPSRLHPSPPYFSSNPGRLFLSIETAGPRLVGYFPWVWACLGSN